MSHYVPKDTKARRSFKWNARRAEKCRHEKFMPSCNACPDLETCEIQKAVKTAYNKLQKEKP